MDHPGVAQQEAAQQVVAKFLADAKASGTTLPQKGKGSRTSAVPAFEAVDCSDDDLLDGDCAANAIAQLRDHAKTPDKPFFLAVGFANPHVPWISPKKYWDLYDRAKLPLATNEFLPKGAPDFAATSGQDFRWYANVPQGDLPEPFKRECLHGYLAAISYVDAQVGRLLAALDETGLAKNTIVVFWSDHGYYMGEHTWWGAKHNDGFQGRSLKPVLEDPTATVNDAAFSWYPKEGWLGIAMRTDKWRFVEWTKSGQQPVRELYNQVNDPQNNLNVADKPEHAQVIESLSKRLREKFPVQEFKEPLAAGKKGRKK
ncbi:MAG: sulfatase-like hydrolase/transferase [Prosthecobacter sp.]